MWRFVGEYATDITSTATATGGSSGTNAVEQSASAASNGITAAASTSTSADDWEPQPLVSIFNVYLNIYIHYVFIIRYT
jgi:hypothetical protein